MKYFGFVVCGWLVSALLLVAVFSGSLGFSSSANALNIGAWYDVKEAAMASHPDGGRLVLIGGSSGLYGVRTADVETALGVPSVNFSVHAGLPLRYLLDRAKRHLRPGDLVVLAPEYEYYHPSFETDIYVDFVLGEDPGFLNVISRSEKFRWLMGAQSDSLLNGVKRWIPSSIDYAETVRKHSREKLNTHGDIAVNDLKDRPAARAKALNAVEDLVSFRASLTYSAEAWSELEAFLKWCQEHQVSLLVAFPPTVQFAVYDTPEVKARFAELVAKWKSLGVTVAGDPASAMYPKSSFYDTVYHLNSDGMSENTRRFIDLIRPYASGLSRGTKGDGVDEN